MCKHYFSILIALAALLAASLACNMPTAKGNNPTERMIVIDSLAVTPRESDGKNDLAVSFNYTPGTIDTVITCSIVTSSGVEEKVWSAPFGKLAEAIQDKADFKIRVEVPGNYTLHCWDMMGPASETTSFTISTPNLTVNGSEQVPQAGQEGPVVQKITSPGTLTYYYYPVKYGDHYEPKTLVTCKTEMQVTLTIWQNGTARLDAAGSYYTLYTCTADVLDKFEFFDLGSAEPYGAEYTVQLASLRRTGTVGTLGGTISGTITQILSDGNTQFTLEIGKK